MARAARPSLVVIAGPNGAGKSTLAPVLLKDTLSVTDVNADQRRYWSGLRSFFQIYTALSTTWRFYDNSRGSSPRPIAVGHGSQTTTVQDAALWEQVLRETNGGA